MAKSNVETCAFSVRFPKKVYNQLNRLSKREGRSLNAQVLKLIEGGLAQEATKQTG